MIILYYLIQGIDEELEDMRGEELRDVKIIDKMVRVEHEECEYEGTSNKDV